MHDRLSTTNPWLLVLSFLPGSLLWKWSSMFKDFTSVKLLPTMDIYLNGQALPSPRKIKNKNIHSPKLHLLNATVCQTLCSVLETQTRRWVTPSSRTQSTKPHRAPQTRDTTGELPGGGSDDVQWEQEKKKTPLSRNTTESKRVGWVRQAGRGLSRQKNGACKGTAVRGNPACCRHAPRNCWNRKLGGQTEGTGHLSTPESQLWRRNSGHTRLISHWQLRPSQTAQSRWWTSIYKKVQLTAS